MPGAAKAAAVFVMTNSADQTKLFLSNDRSMVLCSPREDLQLVAGSLSLWRRANASGSTGQVEYNSDVGSWTGRPLPRVKRGERKVRTPQSGVPDNVRAAGFKPGGRKVPQKIYRPAAVVSD
jgi:hypothetical protein